MKVIDSPGDSDSGSGISFVLKSSQGSPNIEKSLREEFSDIEIRVNVDGVTFFDKSRDMKLGTFPTLYSISSLEASKFLGIPAKRVLAFILAITRGLPTSHDNEMKEEEENSRRNIKAKPRVPWL